MGRRRGEVNRAATAIIGNYLKDNCRIVWYLMHRVLPKWSGSKQEVVCNGLTAEDFYQEVCCKALSYAYSYDPSRGAISTWLGYVVRSFKSAQMRSSLSKRRQRLHTVSWPTINLNHDGSSNQAFDLQDPREDVAERTEVVELVKVALANVKLRRCEREILVSYFYDGENQQELAKKYACSRSLISQRIKHALAEVAELIGGAIPLAKPRN